MRSTGGNRMILSLQNSLENPKVAVRFIVAAIDETLRVQREATLTPDGEICFGKQLAPRLGGGAELAERIDAAIAADYRDNL
jgi:hypothetical protein